MKPADAKLQRCIDLIAALLRHHYGATLAELKTIVPGYGGDRTQATVDRMFERDKDELRALGLPIRVRFEDTGDGEVPHYYIKASEMYLPYLAVAVRPGRFVSSSRATVSAEPPRVPPPGYRSVPTLVFEPDELSALIQAAVKVEAVGVDALTRDASSAIQKLTYDLGAAFGSVAGESDDHASHIPERSAAPAVTTLGDALLRRKSVHFAYLSMNRDVTDERTVEPYGLFFSSGHWYLAGRDVRADAIRTFRVSRIEHLSRNTTKPQSVDYEIPKSFRLADHAATKGPWELGDDVAEEMIVEVRGESGASLAARSLGKPVEGNLRQRCLEVRRVDSFVRWIMSFAGEVVPISPPRLVEQYRAVLGATLARYEEPTPGASA